jgi:hypothetical protein
MALNSQELLQGPARIFIGNVGATEPVAINVAPAASAWTDLGLTVGGVELSINTEHAALEADQILDRAGSVPTNREITVTANLGQIVADNLVYAMNGDLTAITTVGGNEVYEPEFDEDSFVPRYRAILLWGLAPSGDGTSRKRRVFIIRKVLSTDGFTLSASKTDQTVVAVTFTGHYVDATKAPFKMITEPSA